MVALPKSGLSESLVSFVIYSRFLWLQGTLVPRPKWKVIYFPVLKKADVSLDEAT